MTEDTAASPHRRSGGRHHHHHHDPAAHRKNQLAQCRDDALFVGPVDPDAICPVGQGVLVNPVLTPCNHEFCQGCLNKALIRKEECPMCRRPVPLTSVPSLRPAADTLARTLALQVYCDNKATGCEWQGPWSALPEHLTTCAHDLVRCRYLGCKTWFQRQHAEKHQLDCPLRPVACRYCSTTIAYAREEEHLKVCAAKPVACEFGCGIEGLTQGQLQAHHKVCDVAVVPCPYAAHGCGAATMLRKELRAHLEANMVEHNVLLCAKVAQQGAIIHKQQARIEKLLRRTIVVVDPRPGVGAFPTIKEGIDAAEPGDRVVVKPGVYKECITLSRGVALIAEGKVTIENGKEFNVVVMKDASSIEGFTLRQRSPNFFCVRVTSQHDDTVVKDCDIQSDHFSCMQIDTGANPRVHGNRIHGSRQCGILVKARGRGDIHHNQIYRNCLSNVYIDEGATPRIQHNVIHSSQQHGVWVKPNSAADISRNTLYHNRMDAIKIEDGAFPKLSKNDFAAPAGEAQPQPQQPSSHPHRHHRHSH